jgi:YidC/Oxa1 family membrane protein insertase
MKYLFNTFLHDPLYNALVFLIDIIPGADVGLAVIILTIIVKLVLFPLSKKAVYTQMKMKELKDPLDELKEKYKDSKNKEEMGVEMLKLYRENNVNPFSSVLLLFIQLPVIWALYWIFLKGGLPNINPDTLYTFVPYPENVNTIFLGLINISETKVWILALITALSQHFQARFSLPKEEKLKDGEKISFQKDFARGVGIQMKWVLPIVVFFISYRFIAVVSLYWTVSNLFAIGQELYMRKKIRKE